MQTSIKNDRLLLKQMVYGDHYVVNAEIHISYNINENNISAFKEACMNNGIKVVVIDLLNGTPKHIMTSERTRVPLHDVYYVVKKTVNTLSDFDVVRIKVELDIGTMNGGLHEKVDYYETHLDCDISTKERRDKVMDFVKKYNYKISRSAKQTDDQLSITKRYLVDSVDVYDEYRELVDQGLTETKLEIECVLFDSNIEYDGDW